MSELTLAEIHKTIHELDPKLPRDDEGYAAAMVLLASIEVGPNIQRIYRHLNGEVSKPVLRKFSQNLREQGVWKGKKIYHAGWDDEKTGAVAFWLDVGVAQGYLSRNPTTTQKERGVGD